MIRPSFFFKISATLLLALSLQACFNSSKKQPAPFVKLPDYQKVIDSLGSENISIQKIVRTKGEVSEVTIDEPHWKSELALFTELDLNTPANKDNYRIEDKKGSLVNLFQRSYTALKEGLKVRKATVLYRDHKLISAEYYIQKDDYPYSMEKRLIFYPSRGFRAIWEQKLEGVIDEAVDVEVRWIQDTLLEVWSFDAKTGRTPINVYSTKNGSIEVLTFSQGDEQIIAGAENVSNDSMLAVMPVFQSTLSYTRKGEQAEGIFRDDYRGEDYQVKFYGVPAGINYMHSPPSGIEGTWEVEIIRGEERSPAIGVFEQFGNRVYGTFLTNTGDYRFLEGEVKDDSFYVSGFDGRHLYRFTGILKGDSIVRGTYASGNHFLAEWGAQRNNQAQLDDPTGLTRHAGDQIQFSLEGIDGKIYSLEDARFENKVVLLQIMGSWCPNCMDESLYFRHIYSEYHDQGLEIIALAFEHKGKSEAAMDKLKRASMDLKLPYPVLLAGSTKEVKEVLPQIQNFMSFPTTIFIDRKGEIRRIHTGFSGPSTGQFYSEYKEDTESFIEGLLLE